MTNEPLISVVLPFYNAESTLGIAIESILNQTYENFELILVDNNSTDLSSKLAMQFSFRDNRIKLVYEKKKGVVHAMNTGISNAIGKYIARMDADDYSYPGRLLSQLHLLENNQEIGLVSGIVDYDGKNEGFARYVDWLNSILTQEQIYLNQFVEFPVANPSLMVRAEVYQLYGNYFDGDFPEDYEFFLRMLCAGVQAGKVRIPVLKWSDLPERLTRNDSRYLHKAFFNIKAQYLKKWLEKHNPFYPNVWVWGAGKVARKRSDFLKNQRIKVDGYIDLKRKKGVIHFEDIKSPEFGFILSYVSVPSARNEIRDYLTGLGFREGKNFLICA